MFEELTGKYIESIERWGPVWAGGEHWGPDVSNGRTGRKVNKRGVKLFVFILSICHMSEVESAACSTQNNTQLFPLWPDGALKPLLASESFWFL